MEEEELAPPDITVVGNETTWKMDLPDNHGYCFYLTFLLGIVWLKIYTVFLPNDF